MTAAIIPGASSPYHAQQRTAAGHVYTSDQDLKSGSYTAVASTRGTWRLQRIDLPSAVEHDLDAGRQVLLQQLRIAARRRHLQESLFSFQNDTSQQSCSSRHRI